MRVRGARWGPPGRRQLVQVVGLRAVREHPLPLAVDGERHLLGEGLATEGELAAIVAKINQELDAEVDFALASPVPPPERALEGVYEEGSAT